MAEDGAGRRGNTYLHLAATAGHCYEFATYIGDESAVAVDSLNAEGETALHLAAEFGHCDDVRMLLRNGASLKSDDRGYTALHAAARSVRCNADIVSALVAAAAQRADKFRFLNQRSNVDCGRDTALHLAAANPAATPQFLDEFRDADPRLQNADLDTPFHVAAAATSPDSIVSMLTIFGTSRAGWEIDSVDANRADEASALVNTCAANGNAKAVALLMLQGADVSQGALGTIIDESVRKPDMTAEFVAVYETVVDNAVAWRCVKENRKSVSRGSAEYKTALRETMIYLTTKPASGDGRNMIERCIELGAADMLAAILNTENVYRFDEFGVGNGDSARSPTCSYSRFDVTDFARLGDDETQSQRPRGAPDSRLQMRRTATLDFTTEFHPKTTYLDQLLMHFDEWKDTDLLTWQPLRQLTEPYFGFVQRYYCAVGLIQLMFMLLFTLNFIPDACSLARMFEPAGGNSRCNLSAAGVEETADDGNGTRTGWKNAASRSAPLFLWLVWPTVLFAGSIVDCLVLTLWYTGINLFHSDQNSAAARMRSATSQPARRRSESWLLRMLPASFHIFPLLAFCISFLAWYDHHSRTRSLQTYLHSTFMVYLFGWMTNFVLFSGITKQLHVFLMVLKEIIIKDMILNFSLVFIFTVIAFACCLHTMRMIVASHDLVLPRTTVYEIFMSALGVGDFIERVTEDSADIESSMALFFAVYALYVCFTLIILMNILIAMLSNR